MIHVDRSQVPIPAVLTDAKKGGMKETLSAIKFYQDQLAGCFFGRPFDQLQQAEKEQVSNFALRQIAAAGGVASTPPLQPLAGIIVVTAKSYANALIASRLKKMEILAPIVILQNGIGVENPYLDLDKSKIHRCVLYVTGQKNSDNSYTFVPITASPIGVVRGDENELGRLVNTLNTTEFPFVSQGNIQQEVWKKVIINSVFNSICPLLEIDNGIFTRDDKTALLAREVVEECITVMRRMGFHSSTEDIMQQIFAISKRSDGQLISTLQDINHGRETEIDYLNLEIARIAGTVVPELKVSTTRVLGEMVKIKSMLRKKPHADG